jgi:hypothetical protein
MNRFIFILMIALLPMRGWMGEAMATEMATMNIVATKAINTLATIDLQYKNGVSDCDMHKTKPVCTHCQACHATGLVSTVQIPSFDKMQYAQPLAQVSQFASASVAHNQKPPIL